MPTADVATAKQHHVPAEIKKTISSWASGD